MGKVQSNALLLAGNPIGFSGKACIFRMCIRDSSPNRCCEEYHHETIMLRVNSPIHGGSRDAYASSSRVRMRTLFAVYLTVRLVRVYGSGHAGSIRKGFDDFICSVVKRMD